jgi:DNA-directed RNA polymerase
VSTDLLNEQLALENEQVTGGIALYRDRLQRLRDSGLETLTEPTMRVLKHFIVPVAEGLRIWLDKAAKAEGRRAAAYPYLSQIEPEVAALLTLRVLLDEGTKARRVQSTGAAVGGSIQNEMRARTIEAQNPAIYKTVDRHIEESPNAFKPGYRKSVLNHTAKLYGILFEPWPDGIQVQVGSAMIDIVLSATDLFQLDTIAGRRQTDLKLCLVPTPVMTEWLNREHAVCETLSPIRMPMVHPPKDHTRIRGGGYLTPQMQRPVVRLLAEGVSSQYTAANMPEAFEAINRMQQVPWTVNKQVLEVIQTLWANGHDIPKSVQRVDRPLPPKPDRDKVLVKDWAKVWGMWKLKSREVYLSNVGESCKRIAVNQTIGLANRFRDRTFYFPYFFDFRGRLYPQVSHLSPQGSDLSKGLLWFAPALALGRRGLWWLKVHLANSFGVDKVALDERVKWADDNMANIHAVAEDPLSNHWWHKADSPVQALAAIFEVSAAVKSPDPSKYLSRLPVMVDGSCNGVQHLSAMSRDEDAGRRVNLVPGDKPSDLYGDVAKAAIVELQDRAGRGEEWATEWVTYGVTRSLAKRPTMIVPYNGSISAFREYIDIEIDERTRNGIEHPFSTGRRKAVATMASVLWKAVSDTIPKVREVMQWMSALAKAAAKEGRPIKWTSPSGFVVYQAYKMRRTRRIRTRIGGKSRDVVLVELTDKLDAQKQRRSFSPNVTHSYDAANLHLCINDAGSKGIECISANHDCFGTHAAVEDILKASVLETFVAIYRNNVLQMIHDEIVEFSGTQEAPPPPALGTLNVAAVIDSKYAVA